MQTKHERPTYSAVDPPGLGNEVCAKKRAVPRVALNRAPWPESKRARENGRPRSEGSVMKSARMKAIWQGGSIATSWNAAMRILCFSLAATSIACLLADFYGLCPMKIFAWTIFAPALVILVVIGLVDRTQGRGGVWRALSIGALAGLGAAVAYDLFRLPFVFAHEWGIDSIFPPLNLFKVFPRFGAMILGETIEQARYSLPAQLVGWVYHFSNGAAFGVMYIALVGDSARRHWGWAVLFAVGLEAGMLLTPYPGVFGLRLTAQLVVVTLAAHLVFGVCLGLAVRSLLARPSPVAKRAAKFV